MEIGGISVRQPLILGAGACKTPQSILPYLRPDVSVGAVVTGSYTLEPRAGNAGILQWPATYSEFVRRRIGVNSWGMPNVGIEAAIAQFAPSYPRPVVVSFAGESVDEYRMLAKRLDGVPGIAAMEANLGCPNAHDLRKVPIAYDLETLPQILATFAELNLKKPLWLKLSPYITEEKRALLQVIYPQIDFSRVPVIQADDVFEILHEFEGVYQALVLGNTLPNVVVRDSAGMPVTTPNEGQAGLSGPILKDISLSLVHEAALWLPSEVSIIACGGYLTGDDAADALEKGADAVAFVSGPSWYGDGPKFFADLISGSERLQEHLTEFTYFDDKEEA